MNKRGFFFITDVLLSLTILLVGFMLIWGSYSYQPEQHQSELLSQDIVKILSSKKVVELESNLIYEMWCDVCPNATHVISNKDNTLIQQIAEFYATGNNDKAVEFVNEIFKQGIINPQNSFELRVNNSVLFTKIEMPEKDAELMIVNKKLIMGLTPNNTLVNVVVEARSWQ
jgi:hypothetical protein